MVQLQIEKSFLLASVFCGNRKCTLSIRIEIICSNYLFAWIKRILFSHVCFILLLCHVNGPNVISKISMFSMVYFLLSHISVSFHRQLTSFLLTVIILQSKYSSHKYYLTIRIYML